MAVETLEFVKDELVRKFSIEVFEKLGVSLEDARICADVLLAADLRGIDSHGVARLKRYVEGIKSGVIIPSPKEKVITESQTTALIDAGAGLGQPVSARAMTMAIKKAKEAGVGLVTVRNSNHYGIAGYYSMMALEHDMIGISMTNTEMLVVPTFGRDALLGTNPISVAVPSGKERPFVLDMATSVVPRGKLEVYNRQEKPIPEGWATDEYGIPTTDAGRVLSNFIERKGGGLLPLGGAGEEYGGHKGYGLVLLVDILCGVLSGAAYASNVYPCKFQSKPLPANLGHFFGAIRIDIFRPMLEFKKDMDELIAIIKNSAKAEAQTRIYIHGEKEFEKEEEYRQKGIPLHPKVIAILREIKKDLEIESDI